MSDLEACSCLESREHFYNCPSRLGKFVSAQNSDHDRDLWSKRLMRNIANAHGALIGGAYYDWHWLDK